MLPHAPPFLFIDRLETLDSDSATFVVEFDHTQRWSFSQSPHLLLIEALAQASAAYHGMSTHDPQTSATPERGMLVEVGSATFHGTGLSEGPIHLRVARTHSHGPFVRLHGEATSNGRPLAECDFTVMRT